MDSSSSWESREQGNQNQGQKNNRQKNVRKKSLKRIARTNDTEGEAARVLSNPSLWLEHQHRDKVCRTALKIIQTDRQDMVWSVVYRQQTLIELYHREEKGLWNLLYPFLKSTRREKRIRVQWFRRFIFWPVWNCLYGSSFLPIIKHLTVYLVWVGTVCFPYSGFLLQLFIEAAGARGYPGGYSWMNPLSEGLVTEDK